MKRALYLCMLLVIVTGLSLVSGKTYAAHSSKPSTIRLCSSAPLGVPGDAHIVQGIFNGVRVATNQWKAKFRAQGVTLAAPLLLNDAAADGSAANAAKEASDARTCIADSTAYGYIATLNSSMAQVSEPITNRAGLVMISPSNSNPALTDPAQRSLYEPLTANRTLKYPTYYRVVTTDSLQGPAGARFMKNSLHVNSFFLVDDQQTYGAGLARHMSDYATKKLGMPQVGSGHLDISSASSLATSAAAVARNIVAKNPPAVYCGCDEPYAGPMLKAARRAGYTGPYIGGDAIVDPTFGKFAGGNTNVKKGYASFVGNPAVVPPAFKAAEHKYFPTFSPGPYDALAYDASNIALTAIMRALKGGHLNHSSILQNRAAVLPYVSSIRYHGTIGTITFDHNGDTTLRVITMWKWSGSAWSYIGVVNGLPSYLKPTP